MKAIQLHQVLRLTMPQPEIHFSSKEECTRYAVKVLVDAGMRPEEIERVRVKNKPGVNMAKDLVGLRRYMVQELLAANMSNRQIADALQIGKDTVNADRHHARALYTEKLLASADVHRARLLKEQMDLKEKALENFEHSKRKRTITFQDGEESNGRQSIRIEESAGDVGFLNVAKSALVEQARLLGLHELKREEQQDKTYQQFLKDLTVTIDKEKQLNSADELRQNAVPVDVVEEDTNASPNVIMPSKDSFNLDA